MFRRVFRKTVAYDLGQIYQCDLLTVDRLVRDNDGYRNILYVIEIFARPLAAIPLRRKTSGEVVKAFKVVFKQLGLPNEQYIRIAETNLLTKNLKLSILNEVFLFTIPVPYIKLRFSNV